MFFKTNYRKKKEEEIREAMSSTYKNKELMAVIAETEKMFSMPCPLMNNHNCNSRCIHFQEGEVYKNSSLLINYTAYLHKSPRCKLWK